MHTTKIGSTTFIHNGGYEGSVEISHSSGGSDEITIPFDDLKDFIAEYVRSFHIGILESSTADQVLGTE